MGFLPVIERAASCGFFLMKANTALNTIHEKNHQPCHKVGGFVSSLVGGASTNLVNSKSSMTSPDILQVLKCGLCNGRGYEDVSYASIPCEACKGRGFHEEEEPKE